MLSAITVNRPSQYHHFIRLSFYLDMTKLPYHTETDVTISGKFVTFLLNFSRPPSKRENSISTSPLERGALRC